MQDDVPFICCRFSVCLVSSYCDAAAPMTEAKETSAHMLSDGSSGKLMSPKKVYVVVLQWNRSVDTVHCLESLARSSYRRFQIILVDNCSTPDELASLMRWTSSRSAGGPTDNGWASWCRVLVEHDRDLSLVRESSADHSPFGLPAPLVVILASRNLGFAEGNNLGIRYALAAGDAAYVWLLNNDTEVTRDSLTALVSTLEGSGECGAAQSLLVDALNHTRVDSLGIGLTLRHSVYDVGHGELIDASRELTQRADREEIFGACAASALFRVDALTRVGLFEPRYFAIFEDADLAFRLRSSGWQVLLARRSMVYHKRGVSGSAASSPQASRLTFLKMRNALALKLRFWPFPLLAGRSRILVMLAKTLVYSLPEGEFLGTVLFLGSSLRWRMVTKIDRRALFARWGTTA